MYLPALTDRELISYLTSGPPIDTTAALLVSRLENALDTIDGLEKDVIYLNNQLDESRNYEGEYDA